MALGSTVRIVQASPADPIRAIEMAWLHGCQAIAWDLRLDCSDAVEAARAARIRSEGWYRVARDPQTAAANPEWRHTLRNHGRSTQEVENYIGLNNVSAAEQAKQNLVGAVLDNDWCSKLWLADIQGPPMGCGCGNTLCRSWDNSIGPKVVSESPRELPDSFFPEIFFEGFLQALWEADRAIQVSPILCSGCERGFALCGVDDPDGPNGTGLCSCDHGHCSGDYWPELLERFRSWTGSLFVPQVGLLLMCEALGRNHPVYGAARNWPLLAHAHYGRDLFPCVEPEDADRFENCMILLDAPQDCATGTTPSQLKASWR